MSEYRFLAADAITRAIREEIDFTSVKYELALNGAGAFSGSLPINHPKALRTVLDPARTIIYVERDGQIVWSGFLWSVKATRTGLQCDASELYSYWRHRVLRSSQTFTNADRAAIAIWILGVVADESGSWTAGYEWEPTGVGYDISYKAWERRNVAQIIDDLAKAGSGYGGFDYGYLSARNADDTIVDTFHIWRHRGRVLDLTLEDGGTAEDVNVTIDGTGCANRVEVIGGGQDGSQPIVTYQTAKLWQSYPLLERVETLSDSTNAIHLAYRAASMLAASKEPLEIVDVTAGRHESVALPAYDVGDTVTVRAANGYLAIDGAYRITSIAVTIGDDGAETVKPSFASEGTFG